MIRCCVLCVAQCSSALILDEQESVLGTAAKPEFSSATSSCPETETDVNICDVPEHRSSSDMQDGLARRLNESDEDLQMIQDEMPTSGSKTDTNTLSSEYCASYRLVSTSHDTTPSPSDSYRLVSPSHNTTAGPSDEALDLTRYVAKWTHPAPKRKHQISNSVHREFASVDDMDNCTESNDVVYIKDEVATCNSEWSSSVNEPVTQQRNCLGQQRFHLAPSSLATNNNSSSLMDDATYAALSHSDQVPLVPSALSTFLLKLYLLHFTL